jgi:hypothetical protein
MELDTQPSLFANASGPNPIVQGRSFVSAPTALLQRYAVRYQKKSAPIFSDTSVPTTASPGPASNGQPGYNVEDGRDSYCRALLNRRNARLKSATMTINGTPELRLCNTVALVGNLSTALQSVSLNPFASSAITKLTSTLPAVAGPVNSLMVQNSTVPQSTLTALQKMLVYYISTISHSYTQGREFTTTMSLTHGRHWTDALPSGSVGYGTSGPQTDATYQSMLSFYGQGNANANVTNFVNVATAKLNFIANGAVPSPTTNSQFGFTAQPVAVSALQKFETRLSTAVSAAITRLRSSLCNPQFGENDLSHAEKTLKDEEASIGASFNDALAKAEKAIADIPGQISSFLKNVYGKGTKMLTTYEDKLENALKQEALVIEQALNQPEVAAFQAYLGNSNFKIIKAETFSSGQVLSATGGSAYLTPLTNLGINTSAITSFQFPVAAYVYAAYSPIGFADAQRKVAAPAVLKDAQARLKGTKGVAKQFAQVTVTSTVGMQHLTAPVVPAFPSPPSISTLTSLVSSAQTTGTATAATPAASSTTSAPPQAYYVLGIMVVGINPFC